MMYDLFFLLSFEAVTKDSIFLENNTLHPPETVSPKENGGKMKC